jgi:hypothetical protein
MASGGRGALPATAATGSLAASGSGAGRLAGGTAPAAAANLAAALDNALAPTLRDRGDATGFRRRCLPDRRPGHAAQSR